MAKKSYTVKQERKFNGDVTVATLNYTCEEAELQAIIAVLEGKLTVLEENVTLSSPDDASNIVTGGLVIENVSMVHSAAKTKYFGAFKKPLIFKSSTSVTELQALFKNHKPFTDSYSEQKPDAVYPKIGNFANL